jgi:hypothetical protein
MKIPRIDTETEAGYQKYKEITRVSSPVFQAVEKELHNFLDWPGNRELSEMYEGEEAIYSYKGAVIQAIDQAQEVMEEYNLSSIEVNDPRLDITTAFS